MKNKGVSLIEVLIAVLILAIGLLGMASLQIRSLSNNHNAYLRTQATQLANDMLDRMRSNAQGLNAGYYLRPNVENSSMDCHLNLCNADQMSEYDLSLWNQAIHQQLPNGKGLICIDSTPQSSDCDGSGNILAISLSWSERENGASLNKSFITSFQP